MRISGLILNLSLLIAIAISGCISGRDNPPADLLETRENSEAGVQIKVTYLPEITDATAFDIKVIAHKDYNDDFRNNSYLRDSKGKIFQPLLYECEGGHHASRYMPGIKSFIPYSG